MAICEGCGNNTLVPNKILGHVLCLKCSRSFKYKLWKDKEFETNESLMKTKNNIIHSATNAGVSKKVITTIEQFFDSKFEKGLVCRLNGHEKQQIKVYKEYCQIITYKDFNEDEISKKYEKSLKKGFSIESIISDGTAVKTLAMGLISKKSLIKTGMTIASSVALNSVMDKHLSGNNKEVLVTPGVKTIDYAECEDIQFMKHDSERDGCIGMLKFILRSSTEYYFFFSHENSAVKQIYVTINELINDAKTKNKVNERTRENLVNSSTVADEILKFKNLLDLGAITQEEFEAKKKQLLDL